MKRNMNLQPDHFTLNLIEDKGEDSKWSIVHYGPIVYLTCSELIARFILTAMNLGWSGRYVFYPEKNGGQS